MENQTHSRAPRRPHRALGSAPGERRQHAVVIGGGVAGLCSASALARRFERVTVLERDERPECGGLRRRVPQGAHAHALLTRGGEALEDLLPGFTVSAVRAGARRGDLHADVSWFFDGRPVARASSSLRALAATRPFLEHHLRQRVLALPGVGERSGTVVLGPVFEGGAVRGVRVRASDSGSAEEETLYADLVVDCAGGGSPVLRWLADLGYPLPREEKLRVDVSYVSRLYHDDVGLMGHRIATIMSASPEVPRGAVAQRVEGDRILVTLTGYRGHHPPTDEEGFREHARSLPRPDIARLVEAARPATPIRRFRVATTCRRYFEELERFPEGLLVNGDARCRFNPVYAQGMAVAAVQASRLASHLDGNRSVSWRSYFEETSGIVERAWRMAVGNDLRFEHVEGRRSLPARIVGRWVQEVRRAAATDPVVAAAFLRVANLVDPPDSLLDPPVVRRCLRARVQRLRARVLPGKKSEEVREVERATS